MVVRRALVPLGCLIRVTYGETVACDGLSGSLAQRRLILPVKGRYCVNYLE
jgi:hypothetical protein